MRKLLLLGVMLFALSGCADLRPGFVYIEGHAKHQTDIAEEALAAAEPDSEDAQRWELIRWHAARAEAWTRPMLRLKGRPDATIKVARSPENTRAVNAEVIALDKLDAEVDAEIAIRGAVSGLLGKVLGGAGGTGGLATMVLFYLRRRKRLACAEEADKPRKRGKV